MALDNPTYIHQLDPASPAATDSVAQGDDQIRGIKRALRNTLKNIKGVVEVSHDFLNSIPDLLATPGDLKAVASGFAPNAKYWALCDGRTVARSDGTDNVVLPDLRGMVPIGALAGTYEAGQAYGTRTRKLFTTKAGAQSLTATIKAAGDHVHEGRTAVQSARTGITATLRTRRQDNDGGSGATNVEEVIINDPGHVHQATTTIDQAGSHTHEASVSDVKEHQHEVEFDVVQPSYAVNWYMRI